MPTASERILESLSEEEGGLCDDCLSSKSGVTPRQQVNQRARELEDHGTLTRQRAVCSSCRKAKIVNVKGKVRFQPKTRASPKKLEGGRPWYWEGNVQSKIVTHLASEGYGILSVADTGSRSPGKDIMAKTPDRRELWVSVKGWPEKSANTQARHWFSQALFDMILYREEDPDVELAIGLPAGFTTYENLYKRVTWFKETLPLCVFWVDENGIVSKD